MKLFKIFLWGLMGGCNMYSPFDHEVRLRLIKKREHFLVNQNFTLRNIVQNIREIVIL